jgi:hypothetical protein
MQSNEKPAARDTGYGIPNDGLIPPRDQKSERKVTEKKRGALT